MNNRNELRAIVWFLILAFASSWLLWGSLWLAGIGPKTLGVAPLLVGLGMWGPGLSALAVTRFVLHENWRTTTLNRLGHKRYCLWAWFLPAAGTLAAAVLTIALGVAALDPSLRAFNDVIAKQGITLTISPGIVILLQTMAAILVAPLINSPACVGEEIGWRGFLLPRLLRVGLRPWTALIVSGAIWGVWHAPVIVQGHNYPGHPYLGVLLMTVWCVLLGVVFGWLQLGSGSVWAPTIAHGALNGIAALPMLVLTSHDAALGGTLASVIGWIPLAAFVAWLALSGRIPSEVALSGQAEYIPAMARPCERIP